MLDFQILLSNIFIQDRAKPIRCRTSLLLPPEESIKHPRQTNASTTSTCPSAIWTVELEVEEGTCKILGFEQFI